ncbi:hypothetical protein JNUCC64_01690 [Streptomyces sp. JNUCC 64]
MNAPTPTPPDREGRVRFLPTPAVCGLFLLVLFTVVGGYGVGMAMDSVSPAASPHRR